MLAMSKAADPLTERTDAIEAWVRRLQGPTWRFLRLCGCPAHTADDLVQEALLAALHKRIFAQDEASAFAWLRGAASNLWRMQLRGDARRAAHTARAAAELAFARGGDDGGEAWLAALRECVQRLDGRARELLDYHYTEAASREAIASAMGLQPEGVKTYLRRVREVLRECVLRRVGAASEVAT
jgi:RNA polymerase sigma-70 factor (ECF subfamily)